MATRVCEICGAQRAFFGTRHFAGTECQTAQKALEIDVKDTSDYERIFGSHKFVQDWDGKIATIESLKARLGASSQSEPPIVEASIELVKETIEPVKESVELSTAKPVLEASAQTIESTVSQVKISAKDVSEVLVKKIEIPKLRTLSEQEKQEVTAKTLDIVQPEIPPQTFKKIANVESEETVELVIKDKEIQVAPDEKTAPMAQEVPIQFTKPFWISSSKGNTWAGCHRLYKYTYVDKLPQPPQPAMQRGSFAHKVLENFHRAIMSQGEPSSRALLMSQCFRDTRMIQPFVSQLTSEDLVEVKEMLQKYLQTTHMIASKTIYLEQKFKFSWMNLVLNGVVDRVDQLEKTSYEIIDYKTDKEPPTVEELQESDQLVLYDWWLRTIVGKNADILVSFWYLRHGKKVTLRSSPDLMQKIAQKFSRQAQEIQLAMKRAQVEDARVVFDKNLSYRWHWNCPYLEICNKDC